jgi:EpsD family peptidyl-prolyl cis-trans isomerase
MMVLLAALLLVSSGCGAADRSLAANRAVATVNGKSLSASEFERFVTVKLGGFADEPLNDRVRSAMLDEFVQREVTVQAAAERGLVAGASRSEPALDEQILDSLVERYYREVVLTEVEVTPDEVEVFYDAHRDRYADRNGYAVREIRVRTRDEAERARRRVAAGDEAFAELARTLSVAPTASKGGLAFYAARALPPDLERVVAPLEAGQMSGVVETKLGYHVFLLERRGLVPPFENVRDTVARDARASKSERLVSAALERLLDGARVEINREHLAFDYEGRFFQKSVEGVSSR